LLNDRNEDIETVELSEHTVNPGEPKASPQDFELLKLLGKGGYGKVCASFFGIRPYTVAYHHFSQLHDLLATYHEFCVLYAHSRH